MRRSHGIVCPSDWKPAGAIRQAEGERERKKMSDKENGAWEKSPAGRWISASMGFWNELDKDGERVMDGFLNDPEFLKHMARSAMRYGEPTKGQKAARAIMGDSFFGLDEVQSYVGPIRSFERAGFAGINANGEELRAAKKDCLLIADFGTSIKELETRSLRMGREIFHRGNRTQEFLNSPAAELESKPTWRLIQVQSPVDMRNRNHEEQRRLLSSRKAGWETPWLRDAVYAAVIAYLLKGMYLFSDVGSRTSMAEPGRVGQRYGVSHEPGAGIEIFSVYDGVGSSDVGMAAMKAIG